MRARDQSAAHALAVAGLAGVFAYQGLVPKLWKVNDDDVAIWQGLGLSPRRAARLVRVVGAVEASFAVVTVARSNRRWPFVIALAVMPTLVIGSATSDRSMLTKAFNPGSLGLAVSALAAVALATNE
jgi:hypothetical protein